MVLQGTLCVGLVVADSTPDGSADMAYWMRWPGPRSESDRGVFLLAFCLVYFSLHFMVKTRAARDASDGGRVLVQLKNTVPIVRKLESS